MEENEIVELNLDNLVVEKGLSPLDEANKEVLDDRAQKVAIAQKKLDDAIEEVQTKSDEFNATYFEVDMDYKIAGQLQNYLRTEAKWAATDCLWMNDLDSHLTEQRELLKDVPDGKFKMLPKDLSAFKYFFARHEGIGIDESRRIYRMLQPIVETSKITDKIKNGFDIYEKNVLGKLSYDVECIRQGLDVEQEPEIETQEENGSL